ncbi:urotensin II-related peptide [Cololabis saira]|uniref:urotensin II-related peptide n=1 Tax=Cololabis saira TaxID=129043 RepID=UPI002AD49FB2|nr:urotensin II-related peptide [Cololabis saira]
MAARAELLWATNVVLMLIVVAVGMEAAPTGAGLAGPPDPLPRSPPETLDLVPIPVPYMRRWLLSAGAAEDTTGGTTRVMRPGRTRTSIRTSTRTSTDTTGSDRRAKMLKMISALEGIHRTFNSTLSSQISLMARAGGRNPARKNKVVPAADAGIKPTTAALSPDDSTASRTSADAALTGRNLRKSQTPQTKKTNKRVCFWKYCSQN